MLAGIPARQPAVLLVNIGKLVSHDVLLTLGERMPHQAAPGEASGLRSLT